MSTRKARQYTNEFKRDVVRLVQQGDKTGAQVARELKIPYGTLTAWVKEARSSQPMVVTSSQLSISEQEELQQLRRDNERLRMERDILKKAAAFFAKENH